jgi:serine/threonine-protein kinase
MELVEGPRLADRIRQGAVPLKEALLIAQQIADALEATHEKGIAHRLKSANISRSLRTAPGRCWISDSRKPPRRSERFDEFSTMTISPTRAGMILGTAPYLSPEQAGGKPVDKRPDIWAFGCVLHDMLAGKPTFRGETTSDILAAVLKEELD